MRNKLTGAALAIAIVVIATLALPGASGDSSDVRGAELYAGSAFAYAPSGDWTDATASGSALNAGIAWEDGMLSGTIGVPGEYSVVLTKGDGSCTVDLTVLPPVAINGGRGNALTGDAVVVAGAGAGALVCPVTVGGPDGTSVSADCDRELFAFDSGKGFVLARDATASDAGRYVLTVRAAHESGPLYAETSLTFDVTVVSSAAASGRTASDIASLGTGSGGTTYVVTSAGTEAVANPSYSSPEAPSISAMKVGTDGRDVCVSSSITDAQKITYNWGDGTRSVGTVGSVLNAAQHTYSEGGVYSVTLTADGPQSSGYAVAIFEVPADGESHEGHGWVYILFAIGAVASAVAFWFTRDSRVIVIMAGCAVLAVASFVLGLGA